MVATASFARSDDQLDRLLQAVIAEYEPLEVWLFGSRAEGRARPESDYDLLVVVPDGVDDATFSLRRAGDIGRRLRVAADVVPCTRRDFDEEADAYDTLAFAAKHKGRRLYPTPGGRLKTAPDEQQMKDDVAALEKLLEQARVELA